ncbi:MAG: hypothetical protein DRP15_01100 [Candidatus Aenigmatarchaeota archaeon]|nr:MAG: hypothetical protein DRP15_01100 [Candidatus Aenigmarchaeota archaeon]
MKILITTGMVIIFISAFFMFFIFDVAIKNQIGCILQESPSCGESGVLLVFGLSFIVLFLAVDFITVYLIVKTVTSTNVSYIAKT